MCRILRVKLSMRSGAWLSGLVAVLALLVSSAALRSRSTWGLHLRIHEHHGS